MKKTCTFEPCDRPLVAKGLCRTHYAQSRSGKELTPIRVQAPRIPATYTPDGLRVCRACEEAKDPDTGFYKRSGNFCRKCHDANCKQWRESNSDRMPAIHREWREANEGHVYKDTSTGYEIYVGYQHPGALSCGITRYHRIVLWDKIGPGVHACHWCGKDVYWEHSFTTDWHTTLVVDHVDWDKNNNDPDNLVPSCNDCNVSKARRNPNGKK